MAITELPALSVAEAVEASAATEFTTASSFVLYGDNLQVHQNAILYRLGPSGAFLPATNSEGGYHVSACPNMIRVDTPGVFRVSKGITSANVVIGFEEV